MKEWRKKHPNATFLEMERAVEEHVSKMCAAMLQEIANDRGEVITLCPQCGRRMWRRGEYTRELEIPGGAGDALAGLSHLPLLRAGAFSPWMSSSICSLATIPPT